MTDEQQPQLFEIDPADARLLEQVVEPEVLAEWPRSLAAMMDVAAAALKVDGLPPEQATRLAGKVLHALARYHGGRAHYLPNNTEGETAIRDRQIFQLWMHGTCTPNQLVDRYRISYQRVMQIIAEQRGLWQRKHAPQLPGLDR